MCIIKRGVAYHIELLLQFFVCVVNTELLKTVLLKHLKTVYIKNSDEGRVRSSCGWREGRVNNIHDPIKKPTVETLC